MKVTKVVRRFFFGPDTQDNTPVLADVYDYAANLQLAARRLERERGIGHDRKDHG